MTCPEGLANAYHRRRLIPFLGAGASMSVAWDAGGVGKRGPSWSELVDHAAHRLGFEDSALLRIRGTDLQILEYFRIKEYGSFAGLTNWLISEMRPPDDALRESPIHAELAKLAKCDVFYTTNYDNFIERAFDLYGRPYRRIAHESHMASQSPEVVCDVVKFHGDLENPDQMVLSERDYEQRLSLDTAMDYRLRGELLGRVVLFVGYSFRDWNVSYLFRLMNTRLESLPGSVVGRRAYITVADPSDFEVQLFGARNIDVIPVSGANQARDIAALLSEMRDYQ